MVPKVLNFIYLRSEEYAQIFSMRWKGGKSLQEIALLQYKTSSLLPCSKSVNSPVLGYCETPIFSRDSVSGGVICQDASGSA